MLGRVIALISMIFVFSVVTACDTGKPTPTPSPSINYGETGIEIIVDEDATVIPEVGPDDRLSINMVPETRGGRDPLARCLDMGGVLTLDMICHDVDH